MLSQHPDSDGQETPLLHSPIIPAAIYPDESTGQRGKTNHHALLDRNSKMMVRRTQEFLYSPGDDGIVKNIRCDMIEDGCVLMVQNSNIDRYDRFLLLSAQPSPAYRETS